jgi:hypothetical protein
MIARKQHDFTFYYPPVFHGFELMQRSYSSSLRRISDNARNEFLYLLGTIDADMAYETVSKGVLERFTADMAVFPAS